MKRKKLFLYWALLMTLTLIGAFISLKLGFITKTWRVDVTKICFLILGIFAFAAYRIGKLTWKVDQARDGKLHLKEGFDAFVLEVESDAQSGWFAGEWCEKLGYTGTLAGFIVALTNFDSYTVGSPESTVRIMMALAMGLATAFYTSLYGVVCNQIIAHQLRNVSKGIERMEIERRKDELWKLQHKAGQP